MFSAWKQEKAIAALVDEAQAVADRLAQAKPHVVDGQAAAAWFWAATFRAAGQDVTRMADWPAPVLARFVTATQTRIAALRKARDYESSDGLALWLHSARALTEPRIAPPVRDIWQAVAGAGQNADAMAADLMREAGLSVERIRCAPASHE